MRLLVRLLATAAMVAPAVVVSGSPAEAAVYTSTGVKCTLVGTSGPDTLRGTSHRDVICGRGGSDVVVGRGGRDLLDGGGGGDTAYGGAGADTVIGGAGVDHVYGGAAGDLLAGGDGDDVVAGGGDGDVLTGGDGDDVVSGGEGDDDLTGGPGGDSIDGNDGTNWCTLDPEDPVHRHCVYDKTPPQVDEITLPDSVDVTTGSADVTVRLHVTDDTGVTFVQAVNVAHLVGGDIRDGWWESTFTVPRWSPPGPLPVDVWLRDRTNRETYARSNTLTVVDDNPDDEFPSLTAASITPTAVDVTTSAATLKVDATVTDALSGVSSAYACLDKPAPESTYGYERSSCVLMDLATGDVHDGSWTAELTVPRGSPGGDWAVFLSISDRARPDDSAEWVGPDEYPHLTCDDTCNTDRVFRLPDGIGRVQVTGGEDPSPPSLVTATITPSEVDSLPSDTVVSVDVHATDLDADGIDSVVADITSATADGTEPSWFVAPQSEPMTGTRHDGVWHFEYTVAQGTQPGTYYLVVAVTDAGHTRTFAAPGSPYTDQPGTVTMSPEQGAGTLTIVQHSP